MACKLLQQHSQPADQSQAHLKVGIDDEDDDYDDNNDDDVDDCDVDVDDDDDVDDEFKIVPILWSTTSKQNSDI